MTISVSHVKQRTAKYGHWRCVGPAVDTKASGVQHLLLHAADHEGEKVKARLALVSQDSDKLKTKDLHLGAKLDAAFIEKTSRVAVSADGTLIALAGVRKRTGGFLCIWGSRGPRKPVVHQEAGAAQHPHVLGLDKRVRPQGVFISQEGQTVVLIANDFTAFVWKRTYSSSEEWRGVWVRITHESGAQPQLAPSAFDVRFTTQGDFLHTTAHIFPVVAGGKALQSFSETTSAARDSGFLGSSRFKQQRDDHQDTGTASRRMCIIVKHMSCVAASLQGKPWQVSSHDSRLSEYATPLPDDTGSDRDIPVLQWDSEGSLVAMLLRFQRPRVCFMVPGHSPCHEVALPSEMPDCCGLVWATDFLVACCSQRGNICLVSRLGSVVSIVHGQKVATHLALSLQGRSNMVCMESGTSTQLRVCNGGGCTDVLLDVTGRRTLQGLQKCQRPRWIRDIPTMLRSLGSMLGVLPQSAASISSDLSVMFAEFFGESKSNVKTCAKGIVQLYKDSILSLRWVASVFKTGSLTHVMSLSRQLTTLLIHHLCDKLPHTKPPSKDLVDLLDAAFHALKWYERKMALLTEQGLSRAVMNSGVSAPRWEFQEHWVALWHCTSTAMKSVKDENRQPLAVLRDVVLARARSNSQMLKPAGETSDLLNAHDAFLSGVDNGGAILYAKCGKLDCAFVAWLLRANAQDNEEYMASALQTAVDVLSQATCEWGPEMYHAPSLLALRHTEGARVCQAVAALLSGILAATRPAVLPPLFCNDDSKLVVQERDTSRHLVLHHMPLEATALATLRNQLSSMTGKMVAALGAELWLAYGRPLEALHVSISEGLTDTAERIMHLLNWQLNTQGNWSTWLRDLQQPCTLVKTEDEGEQMDTYQKCRGVVQDCMDGCASKTRMQTAADATAVRDGWVCASCVGSLMCFFTLRALRTGRPGRAQHMLSMGIATDDLRQVAASQLITMARGAIAQLPPFDVTLHSRTDLPSPLSLMNQVFVSDGKVPDELAAAMDQWVPDAPPSHYKKDTTETLVRNASKLLAWALICLFPASTPAKCSLSLFAATKQYRDKVEASSSIDSPLLDQLRKALRYAWLLQVWHRLHSRPSSKTTILSIPPTWSTAQQEGEEATLSRDGALLAAKLMTWSQDVWETDVIQGAVLSALELVSEAESETVFDALACSFYQDSNRDSIFTIAQTKKGQYNRVARELPEHLKQRLPEAQKIFFDKFVEYDDAQEKMTPNTHPKVQALEGDLYNTTLFWAHELDAEFWHFVTTGLQQQTIVGTEPAARAAPKAGYAELPVLGQVLRHTPLILPYGIRPSGEVIQCKGAPPPDPVRKREGSDGTPGGKDTPSRTQAPSTPAKQTPNAQHSAAEDRQKAVSIRKTIAGSHVQEPSLVQVTPVQRTPLQRPVDLSLPYELLPVGHGGLLLDVDMTPSNSVPPSPAHSTMPPMRRILDGTPTRPLSAYRHPLRDNPPLSPHVGHRVVPEAWQEKVSTPPPAVPPAPDTATTKTSETESATSYTRTGTTVTSTQPPVSTASTSIPDPIDIVRALTPPRKEKTKKDKRARESRAHEKPSKARDLQHDNRGVGVVHYHYSEQYNQGGGEPERRRAHSHKKHHVCRKHRHREEGLAEKPSKHRSQSRKKNVPLSDLLLDNTQLPATAQVAEAMHRVRQAAASPPVPLGMLRPQGPGGLGVPPPLAPPQPVLLRPHTSPALPPKSTAPLSQHFSLPKPAMPPTPPSPSPSLYEPNKPKARLPTPLDSHLVGPTSPGPRDLQPIPSMAHVGLSPMHLPAPSPGPATPHLSPHSVGLDPKTPSQAPLDRSLSVRSVPPRPVTDMATSPHTSPLVSTAASPVQDGLEGLMPPGPAASSETLPVSAPAQPSEETQRPGQHVVKKDERPREDAVSLVGQPVMSATEELLYAKYIRSMGITSADAIITGGIPLFSSKPSSSAAAVPGDVPSTLRDINDMHEARQQVDEASSRAKDAASAPPQPAAAPPAAAPPPQQQQAAPQQPPAGSPPPRKKAEGPSEEEESKKQASLEALLSNMMERQSSAAASAGKELASAFSETLKNLSPGVAQAMSTSAQEGRKMERDGMLRFLDDEGTYLQALARQRLVRPEEPQATGAGSRPRQLEDQEYERWKEQQRQAASKPATADASVDAAERPGVGIQAVLSPKATALASPAAAYLAVRDLAGDSYEPAHPSLAHHPADVAGTQHATSPMLPPDARDKLTEDLLTIQPTEPARNFLNVADTNTATGEHYMLHREFDTRTWALQSGVARLDRDMARTSRRADDVERTMREAAAVVQSSESILRDAQRLKQQRETQVCLDVLKEEAERIERRLTAEAHPRPEQPHFKTPTPSVYAQSPAQVSLAREPSQPMEARSPPHQYMTTTSTTSFTSPLQPHRLEGAQGSRIHELQTLVEHGASGREPFLWENMTTAPVRHMQARQAQASSPVYVSSDTAPLRAHVASRGSEYQTQGIIRQVSLAPQLQQQNYELPRKEVEVPPEEVNQLFGHQYSATSVREVEKGVEASPNPPSVQRAATDPTGRARGKVSRTQSSKSTTAARPRRPLGVVQGESLNTTRSAPLAKRQATRRNPDVPLSLERQIEDLGKMLSSV